MMGDLTQGPDYSEFVEVDPTGRYGRYNEILGKGSSKTVYRAFDEYEGIEVAWNQVKLYDFLQSPEELERLYCEIHLLKTLKHKSIMKFYTSWVDTAKRNINFVTEMFTSGTLRQYRQKHKRVNIRAVKHWCRQILSGLLYLHSHDPPVIHRDLKCDNIFINGNQGQVKIGDLGLAAILRKSHAAHCVGTPEFMAPEIYEEQYNELVDIYSFGMCILEMVTFEYPYSECTHPAQIYKKVVSGVKPDALYKVQDPEVRQFVEKCLATASRRLPAKELLKDPFLQIDDYYPIPRDDVSDWVPNCTLPLLKQPSFSPHASNGFLMGNGFSDDLLHNIENGWEHETFEDETTHAIDFFNTHQDEPLPNVDITIKGTRKDDGSISLKLRIAENEGRIRNIYFPFDVEVDTALSVATEMVAELDITDYDVTNIAEIIDDEISSLVPEWRPGPGFEDTPEFSTPAICDRCASTVSSYGSLSDYLPSNNTSGSNQPGYHCSRVGCMHGRFEEVTYQVEESEECLTEGAPILSSHSDGLDVSSQASRGSYIDPESDKMGSSLREEKTLHANNHGKSLSRETMDQLCCGPINAQCVAVSEVGYQHPPINLPDDYENEIQQELRWLKAKYQMELREYRNQQGGGTRKPLCPSPSFNNQEQIALNRAAGSPLLTSLHACNSKMSKSLSLWKEVSSHFSHDNTEPSSPNASAAVDNDGEQRCPNVESERVQNCEASAGSSPKCMFTAKSFYTSVLLPSCIPRTKSLPVDAVDT